MRILKTANFYLHKLLDCIRIEGFGATVVYSFFKLMPDQFSLVVRVSKSTNYLTGALGEEAYRLGMSTILDYQDWTKFGGASAPVPATSNKDCYIWFTPDWANVWGGGHYTLFRFANHFAKRGNTRQIIFIYNNERHLNSKALQRDLDRAVPDCKLEVIIHAAKLPACKVALATTWQSAYSVRAFPFASNKFYFMQDYEGQFYAYGTSSMQANNSYTFGFTGITGGHWLKSMYQSHGGRAENYIFSTDRNIFYPTRTDGNVREKVTKIFFYGRPTTERRCFELGIASLQKIADKYPEIEIIIAGLDLNVPPPFKATLLGNLSLKATGDLYRECDIGIAFSGTNLSYLPVELMACGVPVISNNGPHVEWYCRHMENAYLVDPTPTSVLEAVDKLKADKELRQKLAAGGIRKTAEVTWESEMDRIYDYIQGSGLK
jgi:glycosyltransferase involved in cell wall biosynthesis